VSKLASDLAQTSLRPPVDDAQTPIWLTTLTTTLLLQSLSRHGWEKGYSAVHLRQPDTWSHLCTLQLFYCTHAFAHIL